MNEDGERERWGRAIWRGRRSGRPDRKRTKKEETDFDMDRNRREEGDGRRIWGEEIETEVEKSMER